MNRDAKNINSSLRPQIDHVKSYVRNATRPFDGDGYVFTTALKELRKEGLSIKHNRAMCNYTKQD